ncbi:vWA domain-containing protein [Candidatus Enterococcus clewellii]|uniref:VWFA domain-containing protein n=1 Tax=Candidatus Enterococcus clewellii TaxID=1834193 RepID=A0A242KCY5_9ENTE|nr:vWA domain-containing protein [Enterococcus sp. 9E7_DIV0242]OTP19031.1 hypothetical protein A5888_000845 [Enterococcus sp. 9E7_DIV0242]
MKKAIIVLLFLISGLIFGNEWAYGEEKEQDILFVADVSYSMASHDPEKHIFEAIQLLGSKSINGKNRLGYVLYNDSIVKDQNLTELNKPELLDQWMEEIKAVTPIKGTDVGLGLKTAQRIMKVSQAKTGQGMIILLSDGDTEVDSGNPNRNQEAINLDVRQALDTLECPLYVIQYSELEYRDKGPMNQWAGQTGGRTYSVQTTEELQRVVNEIYELQTKKIAEKYQQEVEQLEQKKKVFTLAVPVPKNQKQPIKEIVVTLKADDEISEIKQTAEASEQNTQEEKDVSIDGKGNQLVITLRNPTKTEYVFNYQTESNNPAEATTKIKLHTSEKKLQKKPLEKQTLFYSILVAIGLIIGGSIMFFLFKRKHPTEEKQVEYFFADALEGCFTKAFDQEDIPIQNWPANIFQRQKTVTLYDLLYEEEIREKMPDSKKVQFQVGVENTLKMRIRGSVEGIQQGREIPKGVWVTLSVRQGAYLIFKQDELEIDLHIRKKSI